MPLRAPVQKLGMARAAAPDMVVPEAVSTLETISQTLATSSGDFGGSTIPVISLGVLAGIIAILAGPVDEE